MTSLALSDNEEKPLSEMADMKLTRRLLAYIFAHKGLFGIALVLYPITAATVVLPPYLIQQVLDVVIPAADVSALIWYGLAYFGALVVEYVTSVASQFAMSVLGQRSMRTLRAELFAHVQKLPAKYFDRNPIGRVLTRLTNDVEALGEVFATGAITVIGDLVTVSSVVAMMFWLDARLALYSFLVVPPMVLLTLFFRVYARRAFRDIRRHLARINAFLAEHIAGMSVVQLFRQERRTAAEFGALNAAYRDSNRSAILFDALLFAIVEAIGTAAVAAMLWFGAGSLAEGVVGAGTFIAFVQYIRRFFIPIRDLSTKYTVLQSAFAAAERIFALHDEPLPIDSAPGAQPVAGLKDQIALRDVWFSYADEPEPGDEGADWILRGINLQVRRGEKVALVGATGSGKTTVLKILNRTYDIQKGAVEVDGLDVRDANLTDLRRLFAVVLQDVYLFSGTIMDNLTFSAEVSADDVRRAAEAVQAHEFIEKLPKAYDTPVQELGANFSAGERQLLAFARALAFDPQILVLDEATSSVDSETEARIQAALDILLQDRTAIIVAHRLSTIRKVDRILVLQHGVVTEEGSHDELVAKGGFYSKLVELQLAHDVAES